MMECRKLARAAAVAAGLAISASGAQAADMGAVNEPIRLAMLEWTGAHVSTRIAGHILEEMGYTVEYVTAGNFPHHAALADGTIHASLEVWLNNVGDIYPQMKEAGRIVDLGLLGLETREGWMYPVHVREICPGLPDWRALADCAQDMATAETFPKGRILSYPADWGTRSADMIKGFDLPYEAVPAGSEGALVAELRAAVTAKRPLVMMFWGPHWALAEFDVEWVEKPAYEPACETDPSWGPNPNEVNDCGVPVPDVMKVAWSGFDAKWPAAHAFLQNFQVTADEQAAMMLRIDRGGEDLDAVTREWVENNRDVWEPWVAAAM